LTEKKEGYFPLVNIHFTGGRRKKKNPGERKE